MTSASASSTTVKARATSTTCRRRSTNPARIRGADAVVRKDFVEFVGDQLARFTAPVEAAQLWMKHSRVLGYGEVGA